MNVKPMIFNADMVRALLDGRKIQTRRPVPQWQRPRQIETCFDENKWMSIAQRDPRWGFGIFGKTEEECMQQYNEMHSLCPFAIVGTLLYVRESFQSIFADGYDHDYGKIPNYDTGEGYQPSYPATDGRIEYFHCDEGLKDNIKPSIHMPRWASRLTLKVTGVRIERIQSISKQDAEKEGFKLPPEDGQGFAIGARTNFRHAWQQIYGESWNRNDWVWVIDFDVIHKNVDEYIRLLEVNE